MRVADLKERRVVVAAAIVFALIAVGFILWRARAVIFLLFAGVLLAQTLIALSLPLTKYARLPPKAALAVVLIVLSAAAFLFGKLVAPTFSDQVDELVRSVPAALSSLENRLSQTEWGRALLSRMRTTDVMRLVPAVGGAFTATFNVLLDIAIIVLSGLYLAFAPYRYIDGTLSLFPPRTHARARALVSELGRTLRWWLVGRLVSMAFVTIAVSIGLNVIGVPLAVSLGVIAGLFTFVPYLGFIIGGLPILLFAYTSDPSNVPYAIALYIGVNIVEGSLVEPLIEQRSVRVPPVLGIFSQLVLALIGGVSAVIVAVPLTGLLIVTVKRLYVEPLQARSAEEALPEKEERGS